MDVVSKILTYCIDIAIYIFEFMGLIVIVAAGIRGIFEYVKHQSYVRLHLAKGMALGLEFKLGSEILRTVVVRDFTEILTVACIIALRAALSFLIHWEIKNGKEEDDL